MGRECSMNDGEEDRICIIGGRSKGKRSLGRPRLRFADNIKMDLIEIG
jgi:hypothetical protein